MVWFMYVCFVIWVCWLVIIIKCKNVLGNLFLSFLKCFFVFKLNRKKKEIKLNKEKEG